MKRESHTIDRSHQIDSAQRHFPLVDLLVDTRAELLELAVASGLQVLTRMLEEDRTVICGPRYQQSLATTNAIESLISRTRHVKRNVKLWRGGQMVLRWTAAAILEAVKGFRRLKGHADMPKLVAALRARDQQLGIAVSVENVAENVTRTGAEFQKWKGQRQRHSVQL